MSCRIADIPVPPECGTMIQAGALVAINTSSSENYGDWQTYLAQRISINGRG